MLIPLICAAVLAGIHLLADRLNIAEVVPRSVWLSAASGASVAFVFLLLLPELARWQEGLNQIPVLSFFEHHVWLAALIGLAAFFSIEHVVLTSPQNEEVADGVFASHVGVFALYNMVMGYLLLQPQVGFVYNVMLYTVALGIHLLVIDDSMRRHHPRRYHQIGRWIMAGAVLAGALVGAVTALPSVVPALSLAFLSGGMVLNALKEELPDLSRGKIWPFISGAAVMALLILVAGAVV
jgi:hypothetical protein